MAHTGEHDDIVPAVNVVAVQKDDGAVNVLDENGSSKEDVERQHQHQPPTTRAEDDAPFSVWTKNEKRLIVLTASMAAFFSPISAHIYYPALNQIAHDLKVSNSLINLSITTYMLLQGLAPTFIGEFSDQAGRRPAYLVCGTIYIAANIGLAVQNSYAGLLVLRCLQSAGSSGTVALIYAVVADIITASERGSYVAYSAVFPQVGPSLGPIIGGLLSEYVNWHFIFWFLVIVAAAIFVPLGLFLPETCRKIVGDGSIRPPKINWCLTNKIQEQRAAREDRTVPFETAETAAARKKRRLRFPNPLAVLKLLTQKECGPVLFYAALVCCGMYTTVAMIPSQFERIYGFNDLQISLCYIPLGCGTMAASFVRGRLIDARFRHYAKKLGVELVANRRVDLTNFPIERARIEVAIPTLLLASACIVAFGWTVHFETNLAGPLILLFFIGFCVSATLNTIQVLLIDIYPGRAGAVTAANNLLRCWLGAGATALVIPMINAMGIGWTCTFFGIVILAFSPLLWYIMRRGPHWRKETAERKRRKVEGGE